MDDLQLARSMHKVNTKLKCMFQYLQYSLIVYDIVSEIMLHYEINQAHCVNIRMYQDSMCNTNTKPTMKYPIINHALYNNHVQHYIMY